MNSALIRNIIRHHLTAGENHAQKTENTFGNGDGGDLGLPDGHGPGRSV
jgi:hypothetical protein